MPRLREKQPSFIRHSTLVIRRSSSGFTVLELLVASLLLGMLMTILTMIFNQSSIAWRTGVAGVADLDDVREKISDVRYKADNVYVWEGQAKCIRSVFDDSGNLRTDRQISDQFEGDTTGWKPTVSTTMQIKDSQGQSNSLRGDASSGANYVVNVMSAGPDGEMDTYDDIWSFPDDPNEW